jgi:hypothetical protein
LAGSAAPPTGHPPLVELTPAELIERPGAVVYLRRDDDGRFAGSTPDDACKSDFRGASYATPEVVVSEDLMVSWDRGWDASGEQVWGATGGGYRFRRVDPRR